jgi:hypothetical protein
VSLLTRLPRAHDPHALVDGRARVKQVPLHVHHVGPNAVAVVAIRRFREAPSPGAAVFPHAVDRLHDHGLLGQTLLDGGSLPAFAMRPSSCPGGSPGSSDSERPSGSSVVVREQKSQSAASAQHRCGAVVVGQHFVRRRTAWRSFNQPATDTAETPLSNPIALPTRNHSLLHFFRRGLY